MIYGSQTYTNDKLTYYETVPKFAGSKVMQPDASWVKRS